MVGIGLVAETGQILVPGRCDDLGDVATTIGGDALPVATPSADVTLLRELAARAR